MMGLLLRELGWPHGGAGGMLSGPQGAPNP
jgi:hypothetical protein